MNSISLLIGIVVALFYFGDADVVQACVNSNTGNGMVWLDALSWLIPAFCFLLPFVAIKNKEVKPGKISKASVLLYLFSQFVTAIVAVIMTVSVMEIVAGGANSSRALATAALLLPVIMQFAVVYLLSKKLFTISTPKAICLNTILVMLIDGFIISEFMVVTLC